MSAERYSHEVIRLSNGIRFPLLMDTHERLPHGLVTDYSLEHHYAKPLSTCRSIVDTIGMFLNWADKRRIDLDERFGTGNLFDSKEVTALAQYLWTRRNGNPQSTGRCKTKSKPQSVVGQTQANRIDQVLHFMAWRTARVVSSLPVHDQRVANINERLSSIAGQLKELKGKSVSTPRGLISEEQALRLFQIVRPGSDENPFHKETQLRNFFILLLYYELGPRRAEPLLVKGTHLHIGPRATIFLTYTPHDVADPRIDQPSLKTVPRLLPMGRLLATTAHRLLRVRHSSPRTAAAAKKTPFLVLNSDNAKPLSLSAIYDLFVLLRERFPDDFPPDFAAHHLRRAWNYRFSNAIETAGIDSVLADHLRRYIMGWSKTSKQPANYNQKFIEEQAFKILLGMQDTLSKEFE